MRTEIAYLAVVLALAGCDRPKAVATTHQETASIPAPAPQRASVSARLAPLAEQQGELPLDELTGIWRVTRVVPDKGSAFAPDDPRIVGSLIDITPDQIRWSYKSSVDFSNDDMCMEPVAGLIDESEAAGKAREVIAPALDILRAKVSSLSQPHQWLCGDGGSWGNETEFQRLGKDLIAMRWTGEVTLILDRIRRLARNPPPLPPTGAYERQ